MKLTGKEGRSVVCQDHEDWETVEEKVIETDRWSIMYDGIFKHLPSGKYYSMYWSVGATEQQDGIPFKYESPQLVEVHQVEKLVKVWETVDA